MEISILDDIDSHLVQYKIGNHYFFNDPDTAEVWLTKSAKQGYARGQARLAELLWMDKYSDDNSKTLKNLQDSLFWFEEALNNKNRIKPYAKRQHYMWMYFEVRKRLAITPFEKQTVATEGLEWLNKTGGISSTLTISIFYRIKHFFKPRKIDYEHHPYFTKQEG